MRSTRPGWGLPTYREGADIIRFNSKEKVLQNQRVYFAAEMLPDSQRRSYCTPCYSLGVLKSTSFVQEMEARHVCNPLWLWFLLDWRNAGVPGSRLE